jgi:MFS family permease
VLAILTVVLSPPISQAADYWGRKWFLVILTAMGFVGCIVVSRSSSMGMVITGLTISGVSYGAQPLIHAVTSEVLPRKYRSYRQASNNVAIALGAIFALYVGGLLTRNSHPEGFRTFWYIVAGIYAVCTVIVGFLYNPPLRELQIKLKFGEKIGRLDWVGYILLTSGLVLFCLAAVMVSKSLPIH